MATADFNFNAQGPGRFRILPESVPIQAEGFFIATAMQFGIGLTFHEYADVSFILSATMFSVLSAYVIFYQSLIAETSVRQILLRAASLLLACEAVYVLYFFSHHIKTKG